ncbi:dihydrofolate reductase [Leucobacter denitrificans]|uniref:Dihydrofolate reductase n=1 Tax=Leucobacter denitrificans TaxID=683042 RepID=A0A7G9S4P7_9MICO|nr:dihydrofolate reductase [Leucobacter denitrificans]QNN62822.1 dihydrofolate reductase [Leucobacter denitrificans]
MRVGMVWAEARDGAIGRDGEMPWHLPEDLAHFREVTSGSPVIMGRRTWESLPERFRPLPGRENIVVSRDSEFVAAGARSVTSLEAALASVDSDVSIVWIMGGGQLYRAAMPLADELVVTRIGLDVPDADTFAPTIGAEWELADPGLPLVAANGLKYSFERYLRNASALHPVT